MQGQSTKLEGNMQKQDVALVNKEKIQVGGGFVKDTYVNN